MECKLCQSILQQLQPTEYVWICIEKQEAPIVRDLVCYPLLLLANKFGNIYIGYRSNKDHKYYTREGDEIFKVLYWSPLPRSPMNIYTPDHTLLTKECKCKEILSNEE